MRKKTIYVLATVMCMSIFTACGSTNRADSGNEVQQEVQAEDNMQKEQQAGAEGNAETEIQTESVPENTAEAVTGEEKTLNGTVDEIKDFMFIVTDDSGASYELSFDAKPQGLENVSVGDKVKVKVTAVKDGKLSLSIKEATDMMAKEIEEEVIELPDSKEEASTSLCALFANIKLDN